MNVATSLAPLLAVMLGAIAAKFLSMFWDLKFSHKDQEKQQRMTQQYEFMIAAWKSASESTTYLRNVAAGQSFHYAYFALDSLCDLEKTLSLSPQGTHPLF